MRARKAPISSSESPRRPEGVPRCLLALLLFVVALPGARAGDALQAIDGCLSRLDAVTDVGYARIAARCPDLTQALLHSPAAAWLPADWNQPDNDLSARGLADLRAQLAREMLGTPAARQAPDTTHVAAVLAAVTDSATVSPSRWTRFKDWLRRALTPRRQAADDGWLRRWLEDLPETTWSVIRWIALALVVAIAAGIALNELRVAGLIGRRARTARLAAAQSGSGDNPLSLAEINRAALSARPGMLLEFIAARLAAEDRLPATRAFTARELWRRARLPDERARTPLAQLAGVSEQVRFSDVRVPPAQLDAAVADGRSVLATLDAAVSR